MKGLTLSLLCTGLITTTAIAEENCLVFYEAQNYEKSAQCFVQKLKKDRSSGYLAGAGISYYQSGRFKEALPYLKEAEKKALTSSEYKTLYSWLGNTYSKMGDRVQQLAYHMKFLDLSLKSGIRKDIGSAYGNLGWYYYSQNQIQKALEYYEKALDHKEELKSASVYGNMAIAYNALKDSQKAEEMYQKAIEIDQKAGDYQSLGTHKTELGIFYFMHDHNNQARTTLEDALVISHNGGDISDQSHALSILAIIDYHEGNVNEAKEKATEALRLAKKSGDTEGTLSDANYAWNLVNGK